MLTIVTTTHDRPFCFSLCEKWVARQTLQPDQWIVVNDSQEPQAYSYTMGQEVVVRDQGQDKLPSICENWLAALPLIKGDVVAVIEDDDWYSPDYLATLVPLLDSVDMAGVSNAYYYTLPTRRWRKLGNKNHASLAATVFRASVLPQMARTCRVFKSVYLDMYLWAECGPVWPGTKTLIPQPLDDGRMLQVGFKRMPGARGLGMGHTNQSGTYDSAWLTLRKWIGREDAKVYKQVWEDHFKR